MFNLQNRKTLQHALPPRNKPAKNFTGALYQFSTVRKYMKEQSVSKRVSDWRRHWQVPPEQNSWLHYK